MLLRIWFFIHTLEEEDARRLRRRTEYQSLKRDIIVRWISCEVDGNRIQEKVESPFSGDGKWEERH